MKVTILLENLVYKTGLKSEHGFSALIEDEDRKILFDCGQSDIFSQNADILKINLSEVNHFVLSHGHYDHSGGLMKFLELNKKADLYIGKNAFLPKFYKKEYIGMPRERGFDCRLVSLNKPQPLGLNTVLFPYIDLQNKNDTYFNELYVEQDGIRRIDEFQEEQFIAILKDSKLMIISGCSHRGISNILSTALKYYKDVKEISLIGGLHLIDISDKGLDLFIQNLKQFPIVKMAVSHCTGIEQYYKIRERMGIDIVYAKTGDVFEF